MPAFTHTPRSIIVAAGVDPATHTLAEVILGRRGARSAHSDDALADWYTRGAEAYATHAGRATTPTDPDLARAFGLGYESAMEG